MAKRVRSFLRSCWMRHARVIFLRMKPLYTRAAPAVAVLVSLVMAAPLACLGSSPTFNFSPDGGSDASGFVQTIYVSQTGDDNNPGTTSDKPKRHFDQAIIAAGPDGLVYLSGRYDTDRFRITRSGTPGHPVTLRPDPNNRGYIDGGRSSPDVDAGGWDSDDLIRITGNDLIWDGIEIQNSPWNGLGIGADELHTEGGDRVIVRNTKVHDIYVQPLGASGDDDIIENCEVFNSNLINAGGKDTSNRTGAAISSLYSEGRDRRARNFTARGNKVHDNWGGGIVALLVEGFEISDNDVKPLTATGIAVDNADNGIIERNHVHEGPQNAFSFGSFNYGNASDDASHDILWRNNIAHDGGYIIFLTTPNGHNAYYNMHFIGNTFIGGDVLIGASSRAPENCDFIDNIVRASKFQIADIGQWNVDRNDFVGSSSPAGSNAHTDDPKFVDESVYTAAGMKLLGSSPLIRAGAYRNELPTDFFNVSRPNPPSIGASEP